MKGGCSIPVVGLCRQCRRRHDLRDQAPHRRESRRDPRLPRRLARDDRFHAREQGRDASRSKAPSPAISRNVMSREYDLTDRHVQQGLQVRRGIARQSQALVHRPEAGQPVARHVDALHRGVHAEVRSVDLLRSRGAETGAVAARFLGPAKAVTTPCSVRSSCSVHCARWNRLRRLRTMLGPLLGVAHEAVAVELLLEMLEEADQLLLGRGLGMAGGELRRRASSSPALNHS